MKKKTTNTILHTVYTPEELREALISDLKSDLRFSLNNDPDTPEWIAYRERIIKKLADMEVGHTPREILK